MHQKSALAHIRASLLRGFDSALRLTPSSRAVALKYFSSFFDKAVVNAVITVHRLWLRIPAHRISKMTTKAMASSSFSTRFLRLHHRYEYQEVWSKASMYPTADYGLLRMQSRINMSQP